MFLTIILVHFGVIAFLIFGGALLLPDSLVLSFFLSQGILVVPTIIFLLIYERREPHPFEAAGFHEVKVSTVLMIILCTFLIMPLVTVLNALTMFFTDNAVAALEGDIVSTPFPVMLFMIGIFGPFCEEFVFRGVIYRSYRRSGDWNDNTRYKTLRGNGISAMLLSSLLFGLMHMNFNQAVYAFAIGIFLVLLVEAAGSLWASVFCHMFFNSCQVVLMYASQNMLNSVYGQAVNETAEQLSTQDLLAALSVYLLIAGVTTPIAGCVIAWIAKNEGRQAEFRALFRRRGGRVASQPMPSYRQAQMNQPPYRQPQQAQMNQPPYRQPQQAQMNQPPYWQPQQAQMNQPPYWQAQQPLPPNRMTQQNQQPQQPLPPNMQTPPMQMSQPPYQQPQQAQMNQPPYWQAQQPLPPNRMTQQNQQPQQPLPPNMQTPPIQMSRPPQMSQQPYQQAQMSQPLYQQPQQAQMSQLLYQQPQQAQMSQPPYQQPLPPMQPVPPRVEYLLSVPLIIAIVLCLGYMSLELILLG